MGKAREMFGELQSRRAGQDSAAMLTHGLFNLINVVLISVKVS